jgi:phospholipase/carboxylesterase
MAGIDDLLHRTRDARGEPEGALVLLHGRGTDEDDLFPLLDELDPDRRLVGVTPRAPLNLPPGGWHWYVVRRVGFPDPSTFQPTIESLTGWFDSLPEALGVPLERTVLGGFSQGAVMAWAMGLGPGRPRPAGILAMSGFIPRVPGFELQLEGRDGLPALITHGSLDPVISAELGQDARDRARAAGAEVVYRETAVPHMIDPRVVPGIVGWLRERF